MRTSWAELPHRDAGRRVARGVHVDAVDVDVAVRARDELVHETRTLGACEARHRSAELARVAGEEELGPVERDQAVVLDRLDQDRISEIVSRRRVRRRGPVTERQRDAHTAREHVHAILVDEVLDEWCCASAISASSLVGYTAHPSHRRAFTSSNSTSAHVEGPRRDRRDGNAVRAERADDAETVRVRADHHCASTHRRPRRLYRPDPTEPPAAPTSYGGIRLGADHRQSMVCAIGVQPGT